MHFLDVFCFVWCFYATFFLVGMKLNGIKFAALCWSQRKERSLDTEASTVYPSMLHSSSLTVFQPLWWWWLMSLPLWSVVLYICCNFPASWHFNSEARPAALTTTLTVISFLRRAYLHFLSLKIAQWSDNCLNLWCSSDICQLLLI